MGGETRAADPEAPLEQGMAAGMQELLMGPTSRVPPGGDFLSKEEGIFFSHPVMKNKTVVEGMGHGLSSCC